MTVLVTTRRVCSAMALSALTLSACGGGDTPWAMSDKTDKISGKSFYEVDATAVADEGTAFLLSGTCIPGFVTLKVTAKDDKKIVASLQHAVMTANLRMRFDDGPEKQTVALTEAASTAEILFHDRDFAVDFVLHNTSMPESVAKSLTSAGITPVSAAASATAARAVYQTVADSGSGTTQQLFSSDTLKIELPLDNGKKPVISVPLKSGDFPKFAARCSADQQKIMTDADRAKYEKMKDAITVVGFIKKLNAALKEQVSDVAPYQESIQQLAAFMEPCATQAESVNSQHLTDEQAAALPNDRDCGILMAAITKPEIKRPLFLHAGVYWDDKRTSVHFTTVVGITDPDEPPHDQQPVQVRDLKKKLIVLVNSENVFSD